MEEGPERVIFDEPELKKGFLGRRYRPPPEKVPHFSNLQFKEEYKVKKVHLIINPYSGKKKGLEVGKFVEQELTNSKINFNSLLSGSLFTFVFITKKTCLKKV